MRHPDRGALDVRPRAGRTRHRRTPRDRPHRRERVAPRRRHHADRDRRDPRHDARRGDDRRDRARMIDQRPVNRRSITCAGCIYLLLGNAFMCVHSAAAVLGRTLLRAGTRSLARGLLQLRHPRRRPRGLRAPVPSVAPWRLGGAARAALPRDRARPARGGPEPRAGAAALDLVPRARSIIRVSFEAGSSQAPPVQGGRRMKLTVTRLSAGVVGGGSVGGC